MLHVFPRVYCHLVVFVNCFGFSTFFLAIDAFLIVKLKIYLKTAPKPDGSSIIGSLVSLLIHHCVTGYYQAYISSARLSEFGASGQYN